MREVDDFVVLCRGGEDRLQRGGVVGYAVAGGGGGEGFDVED